jgi:putative ABC transport system permease protein
VKAGRAIGIAFRSLGRNRLRTFLMMIGIVIGITALTLIVAVGLGARKRVMERVQKFGLENIMIFAGAGTEIGHIGEGEAATTLKLDDAEAIQREVSGVADLAPMATRRVEVEYNGKTTTTGLFGVVPAQAAVWDWDVAKGEFISDDDMSRSARVCLIGATPRAVLFGTANPLGEKIQIAGNLFEVKGIMQTKGTSPAGTDMDDRINVPLTTFMRRVANVDYLSAIRLRVKPSASMTQTAGSIQKLLRERHRLAAGVPDDFSIRTPTEATKVAARVAGTFNILLVLVAAISLIAGGVVVANIMLISVNERRREIGLRKAVGARSRDIMMQFLLEAGAVTLAGGVIGIILGIGSAKLLSVVARIPTTLSWASILIGVVFSILIGIIAGVQPARRAARLQPIEALRS